MLFRFGQRRHLVCHDYCSRYYGAIFSEEAASCFKAYYRAALPYGPHEDDRAGEQFANYVPRMLLSQYMRDKTRREPNLLWATDAAALREQTEWCVKLCKEGQSRCEEALALCQARSLHLSSAPGGF